MRILLLGQGGRENALAWKILQSSKVQKLYVAPGNAGTSMIAENVALDVNDFDEIKQFSIANKIAMLVVGPEDPLVNGIYDFFKNDSQLSHIKVIGPSKEGARLEGSKEYAKDFMQENNIPTAAYQSFNANQYEEACLFLDNLKAPYVLKADGLAAGKGVLILDDLVEAKAQLKEMLNGMFGKSSEVVVIEEFLSGIECSVFVLTDNNGGYKILPVAKDYKRIGVGDTGPNTGGMGAVSPVSFADDIFMSKVEERIIKPTLAGLKNRNIEYKGFIFIGLIAVDGEPKVIEYNVRMGDPETEAVMLRINSDFVELLNAAAIGKLDEVSLSINPMYAVTVMAVAEGYPNAYRKGDVITGLNKVEDAIVFHAGTLKNGNDIVTNGGRVLAVSAMGNSKKEALSKSFDNLAKIHYTGKYFRTDIGFDLD